MSPVTMPFEGRSRSHNEETYWGSGNRSLAEGSCKRSLSGNPCKESGLGLYEPGVGQPFPVLSSLPSQASSGSRMGLN